LRSKRRRGRRRSSRRRRRERRRRGKDEEEEEEETRTTTTTTTSLCRNQTTGCKWQITNLGTTSRNTNIHPFVGPAKGVKKNKTPRNNKDSSSLSVLMLFFTEIFHLLVEQTNTYYQQQLDRQAEPSHQLPDIMLPDAMTFIALALQMGHALKDTLHDHNKHASKIIYPTCVAICVLLAAREKAQRISVPDVTWAYMWCLVSRNITLK
jgi:hypothetical protein